MRRRLRCASIARPLLPLGILLLPDFFAAAEAPLAFNRFRLLRTSGIERLITEDVSGDGRPDILIQQSVGRDLILFIQKPDGTFPPRADRRIPLPPNVFAWCVGRIGPPSAPGPVRLFGFTPEGLLGLPVSGNKDDPPEELIVHPTFYSGASKRPPVYCDLLRDLDGDGLPDVLLPQRDGVDLFRQTAPGRFALNQQIHLDIVLTRPEWGSGLGRFVTTYTLPSFQVADLLGLGRPQFILNVRDAALVHAIGDAGRFSPDPTAEIHLRGRPPRKRFRLIQYSLAPAFIDLNGDGAADILFVEATRGNVYTYLGKPGGRSAFPTASNARPPDDLKKIAGYIPAYWIRDLNGDGHPDLILATIDRLNIISGLQLFLSRQVDINLLVFLGRPGSLFGREPDFARSFTVTLSLYATRDDFEFDTPFFPHCDGDFNGDGLKDLVIKQSPTSLALYPGVRDGVFAEKPVAEFPIDPHYDKTTIHVADLNRDGRSDLILHHVDWNTMFHDVELYISK